MQDWLFYVDTKVVSERQGSRTLEELDIAYRIVSVAMVPKRTETIPVYARDASLGRFGG